MNEPFIPEAMPKALRDFFSQAADSPYEGADINLSNIAVLWAKNGWCMVVKEWGFLASGGPFGRGLEENEALSLLCAEAFISGVIAATYDEDEKELANLVETTLQEEFLRLAPEEWLEECAYCQKARGPCSHCSTEVLFFDGEAQEHGPNGSSIPAFGLCPGSLKPPGGETKAVCESRHPTRRGLRCHEPMGHEGEHREREGGSIWS